MEDSEKQKSDHEVFMAGMPPAPELILEDLPWPEPLSEDPEEDRRLRQKQVAADNRAYYQKVLADYQRDHPSSSPRVLRWLRRLLGKPRA